MSKAKQNLRKNNLSPLIDKAFDLIKNNPQKYSQNFTFKEMINIIDSHVDPKVHCVLGRMFCQRINSHPNWGLKRTSSKGISPATYQYRPTKSNHL